MQIAERRIACAKIIDCDLKAGTAKRAQPLRNCFLVYQQRTLGDFGRDALRIDARGADFVEQASTRACRDESQDIHIDRENTNLPLAIAVAATPNSRLVIR